MRLKRDYSNLPIAEQINKLKRDIKFYYIFGAIWNICVIAVSIVLIVCTPARKLGIGFLIISVPLSVWFGGVMQIKDAKAQIKKLEDNRDSLESEK